MYTCRTFIPAGWREYGEGRDVTSVRRSYPPDPSKDENDRFQNMDKVCHKGEF